MSDRDLSHDISLKHAGSQSHSGPQDPAHGHMGPDHMAQAQPGGRGHRWLMLACCIPMVLIVVSLLASGAAGAGAIVFAVICLGMMTLMMFTMPGGHKH